MNRMMSQLKLMNLVFECERDVEIGLKWHALLQYDLLATFLLGIFVSKIRKHMALFDLNHSYSCFVMRHGRFCFQIHFTPLPRDDERLLNEF